jgi:hypothetical protein
MTGTGFERIRVRWLAAPTAGLRAVIGDELVLVNRDDPTLFFLKSTGGLTTPAATVSPWTDMVGIVWDRGTDPGSATPRHEFVEIDRIVAAFIKD